jgi:hypothetical protein
MHEPKVMMNFILINDLNYNNLKKRKKNKTYSGDKFAIVVRANFCSVVPKKKIFIY